MLTGFASLKPHEAQNLLFDGFGCSHCGQMTGGAPLAIGVAAVAPPAAANCTGGEDD
jgi:hypothetical protein